MHPHVMRQARQSITLYLNLPVIFSLRLILAPSSRSFFQSRSLLSIRNPSVWKYLGVSWRIGQALRQVLWRGVENNNVTSATRQILQHCVIDSRLPLIYFRTISRDDDIIYRKFSASFCLLENSGEW